MPVFLEHMCVCVMARIRETRIKYLLGSQSHTQLYLAKTKAMCPDPFSPELPSLSKGFLPSLLPIYSYPP